ncbi:MAG: superoxide dismutase family protein [Gammaproteobacteria bacterium]|nr:superoxide dismutase family protein [Gammaproteobacteria bacterium]
MRAEDSQYGTVFALDLSELTAGLYGFHVDQNSDCGPAAEDGNVVSGLAAGSDYGPTSVGQHLGPYANGHFGDLPVL